MPLEVKIQFPEIDLQKTQQEIHRAMIEYVAEALKTWVVSTTDHVPVWSGASKATFTKLATQVGYEMVINPVAPIDRRQWGDDHGKGGLLVSQTAGLYGWFYSSTLPYIHIVESRHQFLEAGEQALARIAPPVLPPPEIKTRIQ